MSDRIQSVRFYDHNGRHFVLDRGCYGVVLRRECVDVDCVFAIRQPAVARMVGQAMIAFAEEMDKFQC